ncbi:hypothetical protein BGZ54_006219 [Gamsiella multidivaricata]|nr:hypothetical protein BGZ54_006219 [Gamsiella multidivaricata]
MLGTCFLDKLTKLDRIWSREHFQLDTVDFHRKVLTLKDLEFVWREIEAEREQAPEEELQPGQRYGTQYDQTNTVLIDDSPHKSQLQPYNCVLIRDFNKKLSLESTDIELVKVMKYLQRLIGQQNVSAYIRRHPFDTTSEEFQSKSFLKGIRSLGDVRKRLKRKLRKDRRKEKAPPRVVLVESPEVLEARLKRKRLKHRKKKENRQGRLEAPQKEQREERVKTKMKVRVNAKKAKISVSGDVDRE